MKRFLLTTVAALALAQAHAQQPSPAQMGITPTTLPEVLQVLDHTQTWVPIGTVSNHMFLDTGRGISPVAFGAKCDGATDDTAALQAWASATTDRAHLVIPGVCVFSGQIVFPPNAYGVTIEGYGHPGKLLYAGTSTTLDPLIQIGQEAATAGCAAKGWAIRGLHIMSSTVMTAGDALRISDGCQVQIDDLTIGGNLDGGNHNFFNALHLDGGNSVYVSRYGLQASNDGLRINAEVNLSHQFTDPFFSLGYIVNSLVGVHLCGGVGGFRGDLSSVLANGTNVLIDRACANTANLQITFGPEWAADATNPTLYPAAPQIGVHVSDPGGAQTIINYQGWVASATNQCFVYDAGTPDSGTAPIVNFTGARIGNCHMPAGGHAAAIENNSTSAILNVTGTRFFTSQAGNPTIYNVSGAPNAVLQANTLDANFNVSGGWYGSTVLNGANTNNVANHVVTASANIRFNPGAAFTFIAGPAGGCGLWIDGGQATPGFSDGSAAGCPLVLGTTAFPFSSINATTFRSGSLAGFSGAKTAGSCVLTITGGIITNVTGC